MFVDPGATKVHETLCRWQKEEIISKVIQGLDWMAGDHLNPLDGDMSFLEGVEWLAKSMNPFADLATAGSNGMVAYLMSRDGACRMMNHLPITRDPDHHANALSRQDEHFTTYRTTKQYALETKLDELTWQKEDASDNGALLADHFIRGRN